MTGSDIILVCGLPGCGKSTLAEGMGRALGMPVFSVDPIESAIIKAGIAKSFETGLAAYLVAEQLAHEQLKLGNSVIIDCVCALEVAKQIWRDLARKHQAKLHILECICSDKALQKRRIEGRIRNMHGLPEVTWQDVRTRQKEYTSWMEPKHSIDSARDPKENLAAALGYVS